MGGVSAKEACPGAGSVPDALPWVVVGRSFGVISRPQSSRPTVLWMGHGWNWESCRPE